PLGIDDDEGVVLDANALLFLGADQVIVAVVFAAQDAGQQAHQGGALDDAALMNPAPVGGDDQIHLPAAAWRPAVDRRYLAGGFDAGRHGLEIHRCSFLGGLAPRSFAWVALRSCR